MRNGIVDGSLLDNYDEFKKVLKRLCDSAAEATPFFYRFSR
jgi:hypothetical protein